MPWIMKAGKALNERKVEIRVQYKPPAAGIHDHLNDMRNELVVRSCLQSEARGLLVAHCCADLVTQRAGTAVRSQTGHFTAVCSRPSTSLIMLRVCSLSRRVRKARSCALCCVVFRQPLPEMPCMKVKCFAAWSSV